MLILLLFITLCSCEPPKPVGLLITQIKLLWSTDSNGTTVSKFPPVLEYLVQRLQSQNSNYIHEDLSRPPTYEKPTYTLSPEDQQLFFGNKTETTTTDPYEYEELEDTTEKFFEIIQKNGTIA